MAIHQETILPAAPERLYELLIDEAKFAAATGQPAQIGQAEGGEFSVFGGKIHGRHIELVAGRHVVQAWRGNDWAPGEYSVVRFTLNPHGNATKLVLDHVGYPEGKSPMFSTWHEHLSTGWPMFYFDPIRNYLAAQAA